MGFHGKVAVITGGANGIGRCISENFLDKGALVAVIDTDAEYGARMEEKYEGNPPNSTMASADVYGPNLPH